MKYLLTGGGTGGHVYPSLAIKEIIVQNDPEAEFLYVGVEGKAEDCILGSLSEPDKIPIDFIQAAGLPRILAPVQLFSFLRTFLRGYKESRRIIAKYEPDLIIATGGYVSAPVIAAGWRSRKKMMLHEQNSAPGLVNKTLGKLADTILVTFSETVAYFNPNRTIVAGYPLRRQIRSQDKRNARKSMKIPPDAKVVFIFGGSTGAKIINETIIQNLELLLANDEIFVIHGTGRDRPGIYNAYSDTLALAKMANPDIPEHERYIMKDYFFDIDDVYASADLVVSRAGAGTIMECASLGLPMVIIPKSGLPGNHQEKNAEYAEKTGGAVIIHEESYKKQALIDGEKLTRVIIETVTSPERLAQMSVKIKTLYVADTAQKINNEIQKLLNKT